MAKAASKYISFDTAGNFVSEFADGRPPRRPRTAR